MKSNRYQTNRSYDWNYLNAPAWTPEQNEKLLRVSENISRRPAHSKYAGLPVRRPISVAAGPLLNGHWCLAYATLGFEVVTYKTVRTVERACFPLPNLVPVADSPLQALGQSVPAQSQMHGSWAVSFGMPSRLPADWQRDIAWTRQQLPATHRLAVSVVGTVEAGSTLQELAEDYARCACWAASAGADVIEMNFSCPNVCSDDGQLFQLPDRAARVAECVANRLQHLGYSGPLLAKIGYLAEDEALSLLADGLRDSVTGCVMCNSIPAQVTNANGTLLFEGQTRGICGEATRSLSVSQTRRFAENESGRSNGLLAIGVGGIRSETDAQEYLDAGAESVQVATAAMLDIDLHGQLKLAAAPPH